MTKKNQSAHFSAEVDQELAQAILFLQDPFGDEAHQGEQHEAVQYLLEHATAAHPLLLALLQSMRASNPYAVIEILPQFGLQDSIPVLEELMMRGPTNLAQAAAQALAVHPLDNAQSALLRGLRLSKKDIVIAAADGLMTRGDPLACSELKQLLVHPDPDLRYHVIQAAGSLGCLPRETILTIARDDPSEDIRELANQLAKTEFNQHDTPC